MAPHGPHLVTAALTHVFPPQGQVGQAPGTAPHHFFLTLHVKAFTESCGSHLPGILLGRYGIYTSLFPFHPKGLVASRASCLGSRHSLVDSAARGTFLACSLIVSFPCKTLLMLSDALRYVHLYCGYKALYYQPFLFRLLTMCPCPLQPAFSYSLYPAPSLPPQGFPCLSLSMEHLSLPFLCHPSD